MSQTFQPRACGSDAASRWLREGWETWRRGARTWLVLEVVLFLLLGMFAGWGNKVVIPLLVGITAPYLGVQLAIAQYLASGNVGWGDVLRTIRDDWLC